MNIYYLYIKTHNKTGLKYIGKTSNNPYTYKGSGKYWLRHLKKHGNDVTTEILGVYYNIEDLRKDGLRFSKDNNIVESNLWANLQPESGDGIAPGMTTILTESGYKLIPSTEYDPKIHQHINKGRKFSAEVNKRKGRSKKLSNETKRKISAALSKPDIAARTRLRNQTNPPKKGIKESQEACLKKSIAHRGKKWYHSPDMSQEKCIKKCPEGWLPGRINFSNR